MQEKSKSRTSGLIISIVIALYFGFKIVKKLSNNNSSPSYQSALIEIPEPDLSNYKKLSKAGSADDTKTINSIWESTNSQETDPMLKLKNVSSNYINELKRRFKMAFYSTEEQMSHLTLIEKIEIYSTRDLLLQLYSKKEIKESNYDDLLAEYFYTNLGLMELPKLTLIKYQSDSLAYGIYEIFNNKKSVEFRKEDKNWKINTLKEDPIFDEKRRDLASIRIKSYGSDEKYLNILFNENVFKPFRTQ